jgi:hypothetical protein
MAAAEGLVGGVDPHADTIHVAVLTAPSAADRQGRFPVLLNDTIAALTGFLCGRFLNAGAHGREQCLRAD